MNPAIRKIFLIEWSSGRLDLGVRTHIMGVLNVTPDSFSDGGQFFNTDIAIAHGEKLAESGADILDIGGESTRPFSSPVDREEEIRRVVPVIEALAGRLSLTISIDTTKAWVAKRAIEAGASMVNDISALQMDPEMPKVVAETGVPVILMHMKGTPKNMQVSPRYDDLLGEIGAFLSERIAFAVSQGIDRSKILVDPGIGFGKTFSHNLQLLNSLGALSHLDAPIVIGTSRKAFIRHLLKNKYGQETPADDPLVETGTQATVSASILRGAHIVRVHDVATTAATVRIIDAIRDS
jgi:dihydropteroate synthase